MRYQACNWIQWKWMCHFKSAMASLPIEFSTKFIFCCFTCNHFRIELWSMSEWFEWWSAFWVHVQILCNEMQASHSMRKAFGYLIQMHVLVHSNWSIAINTSVEHSICLVTSHSISLYNRHKVWPGKCERWPIQKRSNVKAKNKLLFGCEFFIIGSAIEIQNGMPIQTTSDILAKCVIRWLCIQSNSNEVTFRSVCHEV